MPPTEAGNGYSLAERGRRWDAVQSNAQASGLDCVFVPIGAIGGPIPASRNERAARSTQT